MRRARVPGRRRFAGRNGRRKGLGKQTGMDEQRGKMTWPSLVAWRRRRKSRASCGHRPKKRLQSLEIRRGSCANLPRRWQRERSKKQGEQTWGLYYWRSSTTASFRRRRWRGAIAQAIKVLLTLAISRKFDHTRVLGSGGMPSSHSSMACAMLMVIGFHEGFSSSVFALAFCFAGVDDV